MKTEKQKIESYLKRFSITCPDENWAFRLKQEGFTRNSIYDKGQYEDLKNKMLDMAGFAVVLCNDNDNFKVLTRGQFWIGKSQLIKGKPCDCHRNSISIHKCIKDSKLVTGFAMSKDSVWRQHSWVLNNNSIIETTTKRVVYYGFILYPFEVSEFEFL